MKLTNEIKQYIEENADLLNNEPRELIEKRLTTVNKYVDFECLLDVANVIGELTDIDTVVNMYQKQLENACKTILAKYDLFELIPCIQAYVGADKLLPSSSEHYGSYGASKIVMCTQKLKNPYAESHMLLSDNETICVWRCFKIHLLKDNLKSIEVSIKQPHQIELPSLYDFYSNTALNKFTQVYESYLQELVTAIDKCKQSFNYVATAEKLAQQALQYMEETVQSILTEIPKVYLHRSDIDHNYIVNVNVKTQTNLKIIIPFDIDPSNIDLDGMLQQWTKNLEKFKKNQDRSIARRLAYETERENNSSVTISRADVTAALAKLGVKSWGRSYTNKTNKSITFKFEDLYLSQDECNQLQEMLENIGASVISVDCRKITTSSGYRVYSVNALYVRVRI